MANYQRISETEKHLRSLLGMDGKSGDSTYINMGDNSPQKTEKVKMKIFCVDLSPLSRINQFLVLCAATFIFFLVYGYLQVKNKIQKSIV